MIIYIYALSHPITKEIRYIGKTGNVKNRYSGHISASKRLKTHLGAWIKSLLKDNLLPEITIIEECTSDNWEDREIYHISQGLNLVNHHKGGNQPPVVKRNARKYRTRTLSDGTIKYEVRVSYFNTVKQLGSFKTEEEAIFAYDNFQANPEKYINTPPKGNNKAVLMFKNSNLVKEFNSISECANYINGDISAISKCCRKVSQYKSHKEYTFKYKEE